MLVPFSALQMILLLFLSYTVVSEKVLEAFDGLHVAQYDEALGLGDNLVSNGDFQQGWYDGVGILPLWNVGIWSLS